MRTLIAGGGGFIGGHLAAQLLHDGHSVTVADKKPIDAWYQVHPAASNIVSDLSILENAKSAVRGHDRVYNLAADMGGMGFIENNKAACMLSVLTGTHMLVAARDFDVARFFFSSSACVYAADRQVSPDVTALKEEDAYPALPEDGYGWEKLFTERMCRHFFEDFGLETRVARYHNVYGPFGTFEGGREKAPAALARKIAHAKLSGDLGLEIWGDGEQTRSFMYVDDCVRGTIALGESEVHEPLNLGSAELVSINQMVDILEEIAQVQVNRRYNLDAPQGVRGRNSDNARWKSSFGWEPSISLRAGLEKTYRWIFDQMAPRY